MKRLSTRTRNAWHRREELWERRHEIPAHIAWQAQARLFALESRRHRHRIPAESPPSQYNSVRYGLNAGAYAVIPELLRPADIVYSVGVGDENSFERALAEHRALEVHAFDPTDQAATFANSRAQSTFTWRFHKLAIGDQDGCVHFHQLKPAASNYLAGTLLTNPSSSKAHLNVPVKRVSTIMKELGHDRLAVLKLDAEGGEYPILRDLIRNPLPIDQLVLEFHPHLWNLYDHGHMLGRGGWTTTAYYISELEAIGFRLFDVSPRGTEFSFVNEDALCRK